MRKYILTILFIGLQLINNSVWSQNSVNDISNGAKIIQQKGQIQLEAIVYPERIVTETTPWENNFNDDIYLKSNFNIILPGNVPFSFFSDKIKALNWSRFSPLSSTNTSGDLFPEELPYKSNLFRLEYAIWNLQLCDVSHQNQVLTFFNDKRQATKYPNTLMSVPFQYYDLNSTCNRDFVKKTKPDLIMFAYNPWNQDGAAYNMDSNKKEWLKSLVLLRDLCMDYDTSITTEKPLQFGSYLQTVKGISATIEGHTPSESQIKLSLFAPLAIGAKVFTSAYNDMFNNTYQSILFDSDGTPNKKFFQQAEANRQSLNIGSALVNLQTKRINYIGSTNSLPIGLSIFDSSTTYNPYLKTITFTNPSNCANVTTDSEGLIGFFNPLYNGINANTNTENYFMIVNATTGETDDFYTERKVRLDFDFGNIPYITSLLRKNRLTGLIETIPLIKNGTTGNKYYLEYYLGGGLGDLYKYNNGIEFVGTSTTSNLPVPKAPTGISPQNFCGAQTVANLSITGTSPKFYDAPILGNEIATTEALVSGKTYYISQTVNGLESTNRLAIVAKSTTALPTTAAQIVCQDTKVASLTATGTGIKWYDAASGGNLVPSGTTLTTRTYYASQTVNGCESFRTSKAVTVTALPKAPTTAAQTVCQGTKVASLTATGTGIKWYDAASGGNLLTSETILATGTYYASQTVNGCESNSRASKVVTVIANSATPANSTVTFTKTASIKTFNVLNLKNRLTSIVGTKVYLTNTSTAVLTDNTILSNGTVYYVSQTTTGLCESVRAKVTVIIN